MVTTGASGVVERSTDRRTDLVVGPIPQCEPEPMSVTEAMAAHRTVAGPSSADRRATGPREPGRAVADRVDPTARAFAVTALTRVLEVIDRRRPVAHLAAVAAPHIVDQVTALMSAPAQSAPGGRRPPSASLLRVHLQWSGPDAAEVAASCARGPRVHAIAARVQRLPVRVRPAVPGGPRTTELRWTLVNVTTV